MRTCMVHVQMVHVQMHMSREGSARRESLTSNHSEVLGLVPALQSQPLMTHAPNERVWQQLAL